MFIYDKRNIQDKTASPQTSKGFFWLQYRLSLPLYFMADMSSVKFVCRKQVCWDSKLGDNLSTFIILNLRNIQLLPSFFFKERKEQSASIMYMKILSHYKWFTSTGTCIKQDIFQIPKRQNKNIFRGWRNVTGKKSPPPKRSKRCFPGKHYFVSLP